MKTMRMIALVLLLAFAFSCVSAFAEEPEYTPLPIEKDVPDEMLKYIYDNIEDIEYVEEFLLLRDYEDGIFSFGGGWPTYYCNDMYSDEMLESDGKDVMEGFTYQGRTFINYTESGKPRSGCLIIEIPETGECVCADMGLDGKTLHDGVVALQNAHEGDRKIIMLVGGQGIFDITDEEQYFVFQQGEYYDQVMPAYYFVGWCQSEYLKQKEYAENHSGYVAGGMGLGWFSPTEPLKGVPSYTNYPLMIGVSAAVLLCGGAAGVVVYRRKRRNAAETL